MLEVIYRFGPEPVDAERLYALLRETYWAADRSLAQVQRALRTSFCISAWDDERMVGFARLITDFATHAYLCDVIVDPACRHGGIGRGLVRRLISHEAVATCHVHLHTRDAHGVYRALGFSERPGFPMWKSRRRAWPVAGIT